MTCYHILVTTKNKDDNDWILANLNELNASHESGKGFEIQTHEHEDDPGEEAGEYLLWYMSGSHKKVRYYAGPPKNAGAKPQWSYKKKDAAKLSHAAATLTAERLAMIGYKTPLKIDKGGPDLTVVKGNFGSEVTTGEANSPEEVIAQAGDGVEHGPFADPEAQAMHEATAKNLGVDPDSIGYAPGDDDDSDNV